MNQIKNRFTGDVICEGEESIKELAVKNKANLYGANLSRANLSGADLSGANLYRANLYRAKIEFLFFPSIRTMSGSWLRDLPDDLQTELMRRDAIAHPKPDAFQIWADGGGCPYGSDIERFWLFEPKRELWSPGQPTMNDKDLILAISKSQGWKIKGYLE
jgi:hypothetical protein